MTKFAVRRIKKAVPLAFICLWLAATARGDGWQGFLRLDTITGGSTDINHPGWMDVQTYSTSISKTGAQAVSGGLNFQKLLDLASPALALACASGTNLASGTLDLAGTNATLAMVFRLNLTNVVLSSDQIGGDSTTIPIETLSLNAQVFSWNYTQFNPTNGLAATNLGSLWDFTNNVGTYTVSGPVFVSTGIRKTTGVELNWNAAAGAQYRIYAAPSLMQPFVQVAVVTPAPGPTTYTLTTAAPAMFYVVEQLPAGY